jgi:hypothetical protein
MSPVATSLIVFACVFGGALVGILLHSVLPENHLNAETKSIVNLGTGIIGTMAALVLGLLVASAKNAYDTQSNELTDVSSRILLLDRVLAHYGPETNEARGLLRGVVGGTIDRMWPQDNTRRSQLDPTTSGGEVVYDKIQELSPTNETQHSLKTEALSLAVSVAQARSLMFEQRSVSISKPLLIIVVFWLSINFISFGLFAPHNATVIATLFLCGLAVSGAIFLILELYSPFTGIIQISSAPMRNALTHLGH